MLRRCLQNRFLLATELPTHRHSLRLKDIVETLTGDAATLSQLRVDSFEYLGALVETGLYSNQPFLLLLHTTWTFSVIWYAVFFDEKLSYGQL